jgi:hypothetical protein
MPSPTVALEGIVEIVHEDRADGTGIYHRVLFTDDQKRWSLDGVPGASDLITGDWVRVLGDELHILAFAPPPNTFGSQKTLVILVNFSNDKSQPYTVAQAKTGYGGLDSWFREVSYQQTSLVVDVVGWYTMSVTNQSCDYTKIQTDARKAATTAGVNLSTYIRHVYAFRSTPPASSRDWRRSAATRQACGSMAVRTRASSPMSSDTRSASIIHTPSTVIPPS